MRKEVGIAKNLKKCVNIIKCTKYVKLATFVHFLKNVVRKNWVF